MKIRILYTLLVFIPVIGYSQVLNKQPLSRRQTCYDIDAKLDTATKTVTGNMHSFWVNMSGDTVRNVQMHLYMNAFRDWRSTYNIEFPASLAFKESEKGSIDIKTLTDRRGIDLKPGMRFISPDDGNTNDRTVLEVQLPGPAYPGDTVFINSEFETKLPAEIRRTGFSGDFYFVAQWFPKFGVYETKGMRYAVRGGWNCHQFHANSEFYADHSVYNVNLTVPKHYVVGSCGIETGKHDTGTLAGFKTLSIRAEDIVDFAWTAWPGYAVFRDKWKNVEITLLIPKERSEQATRHFKAVEDAMEYFDKRVGPYPWSYLTIVDPPPQGDGAGGMEYTTLFTTSSAYLMPRFFHMPEMVTIHEFGHAYFMGILASNEFEEPWLDEGVNSFWEERILDHYYGENSGFIDHPFLKASDESLARLSYVHSNGRQDVSNAEYSWNYPHGTYSMMSYHKTATWLYTLMGITGEETTDEIFREYYKKWAFRHPCGKDFVDVVNEVVTRKYGNKFGKDMNWFFDQTLYGTGICDYKVTNIINRKIETDSTDLTANNKAGDGRKQAGYNSVVELERDGELMLPVEVLIHFSDGQELLESWDGRSRFKDYKYSGARTVHWVKIDPGYKNRMDVNFNNNSMTVSPDRIPARRLTTKLIALMQFFLSIISL